MKKILLLVTAIGFALASLAQKQMEKAANNRAITLNKAGTAIILNDGINLNLLDDATDKVFIEGEKAMLDNITISLTGSELTISNSFNNEGHPLVVSLSARLLKNITINGNSLVGSYQLLQNKQLDVLVNGNCKLLIRTAGVVNVSATEDFAYTCQSTTPIK